MHTAKNCGEVISTAGNWQPLVYTNGHSEVSYAEGYTKTDSESRTSAWEASVGASVTVGYEFGNLLTGKFSASVTVSSSYTQSSERSVASVMTEDRSKTHTTSFPKAGDSSPVLISCASSAGQLGNLCS